MHTLLQHPVGKIIALSIAAILGVNARYWLSLYVQQGIGQNYPWGNTIINLSGSLLIGLLIGLTTIQYQGDTANQVRLIFGTGFLGTYTTFSGFSFDTVALGMSSAWYMVVLNIGVSVIGGCLLAWLGYILGTSL